MNRSQNFYGITCSQNVDETVHHLKVALAGGAEYFTIALSLIVKTETATVTASSAYVILILGVITERI